MPRVYIVSTQTPPKEVFVASEVEGRQVRMAWMKEHSLQRKQIAVDFTDVPTKKPELLLWLNTHLARK